MGCNGNGDRVGELQFSVQLPGDSKSAHGNEHGNPARIANMSHELKLRKGDPAFPEATPMQNSRRLKGEDGNGLVEYALVFMVFISLLLGIVDFSRALYTYHFLSDAAREATRWAAVNGATCTNDGSCAASASVADIRNFVANITPPGVDPTKLDTDTSWPGTGATCPGGGNNPGCPVQVTLSYPFTFVVPFISTTPLTLSSSSEMTILH
jgi:Flp pilus assembly protein TadG